MMQIRYLALCVLSLLVAACGSGGGSAAGSGGGAPASRDGTQQRVEIASPVDGEAVVFELFEPDQVVAGERYPLILEGHGFGGSRQTERSGFIARLLEAGYYVISIDQRGFGESGGSVRVMDPDFEGQDLVAILDWADANLEQLARDGGRSVVGAIGSSYGGGYQLLLNAVDPQRRLRAIVPDIAWHDLPFSLNPNDGIKSGWALLLTLAGESGSQLRMDTRIRETLVEGLLTNRFPAAGRNFFRYHSQRYFCDGEAVGPMDFASGEVVALTPPSAPPPIDALIWQGFRDTLFNVNEGLANFECLRQRGGDVRLLTHQSGHILPLSINALPGIDALLDPLSPLVNVPAFQEAGGSNRCGDIDRFDATLAWFDEKLKGQSGRIDAVITSGRDICLSLAEGEAVTVAEMPRGGEGFAVEETTPVLDGVLGIVGDTLGSALPIGLTVAPLTTIGPEGAILAGVPQIALEIAPLLPLQQAECQLPVLPLACDPLVYAGIGRRAAGAPDWELIDDQILPLRGFRSQGTEQAPLDLIAVAERLAPGDELGLMVFGFHPQYPVTFTRDLLLPALRLSGRVYLPLLADEG